MVTSINIRVFDMHIMSATHLFTEMFIQQRIYLKHNTHTCGLQMLHHALLTYILECNPATADTEKADIHKS